MPQGNAGLSAQADGSTRHAHQLALWRHGSSLGRRFEGERSAQWPAVKDRQREWEDMKQMGESSGTTGERGEGESTSRAGLGRHRQASAGIGRHWQALAGTERAQLIGPGIGFVYVVPASYKPCLTCTIQYSAGTARGAGVQNAPSAPCCSTPRNGDGETAIIHNTGLLDFHAHSI